MGNKFWNYDMEQAPKDRLILGLSSLFGTVSMVSYNSDSNSFLSFERNEKCNLEAWAEIPKE